MKKVFGLSLVLASCLASNIALAGAREYTVKGLTTDENVKAVKTKVCALKSFDNCEVSPGKIKLTSKTDNKAQDSDLRKALKDAGNFEITGSKDAGNGKEVQH